MRTLAWILGILAVICLAGGMGAAQKAGLLWQSGRGLEPQQAVM
ncbi:hypothetical protein [Wenxinia marina]|uniref:Uncharacterized protein n=1 Tax=Wenxinia marina DSM 24838 TaxID=1123501 RepID=A0A0D0NIS3_9RHOB|nr:hypothetical protein [Wenxinia marina]KIQ68190.1 hypothetical protein Wenmar_03200 [Wenxinia marina DSM 24838]GGL76649.1 hypothetical protein GCM10011392_33840 [Wenxinia marina]